MNYFLNKFCVKWIILKDCIDVNVLLIDRFFGYFMINFYFDVVFFWYELYGIILWYK